MTAWSKKELSFARDLASLILPLLRMDDNGARFSDVLVNDDITIAAICPGNLDHVHHLIRLVYIICKDTNREKL